MTEEVTNEFGEKVKIFKPHPVYEEMHTMKEMINSFDQTKLLAPLRQERETYSLFLAANGPIAKSPELVVEAVSERDDTVIQA